MSTKPKCRLQRNLAPKDPDHKINLDPRLKNNERRDLNCSSFNYLVPARRLTIDRRLINS